MSNERKAEMPQHCGNCIFHEWGEDRSTCMHPHKVRRTDLVDDLRDMAEADAMSAHGIAESLLWDAIADQEWQPYDHVCDHWRGRECKSYPDRSAEEKRVRAEAVAAFEELVESLMP